MGCQMKTTSVFVLAFFFTSLGYSMRAAAWGPVGHETVAYIAQANISSKTKSAVDALLGKAKMATDAPWADTYRVTHPETEGWHFIDIPIPVGNDSPKTEADEPTYCVAPKSCVVDQINSELATLKDSHTTKAEKKTALMFLIHFVGDVHQPLHCANDDDRGGNDKNVRLKPSTDSTSQGTEMKLHAVWDHLIEVDTTDNPKTLAGELDGQFTDAEKKGWQAGTPADWALESYNEAIKIYAPFKHGAIPPDHPVELPSDYYATGSGASPMRKVVNQRLEQAGVRLAWLLNQVFDSDSSK